ncbi:hypothetical protein HK405_002640 [Cladochytrium tenue]|nr:hypothetical protein HK405_002640 [Cladochytrium tenue]
MQTTAGTQNYRQSEYGAMQYLHGQQHGQQQPPWPIQPGMQEGQLRQNIVMEQMVPYSQMHQPKDEVTPRVSSSHMNPASSQGDAFEARTPRQQLASLQQHRASRTPQQMLAEMAAQHNGLQQPSMPPQQPATQQQPLSLLNQINAAAAQTTRPRSISSEAFRGQAMLTQINAAAPPAPAHVRSASGSGVLLQQPQQQYQQEAPLNQINAVSGWNGAHQQQPLSLAQINAPAPPPQRGRPLHQQLPQHPLLEQFNASAPTARPRSYSAGPPAASAFFTPQLHAVGFGHQQQLQQQLPQQNMVRAGDAQQPFYTPQVRAQLLVQQLQHRQQQQNDPNPLHVQLQQLLAQQQQLRQHQFAELQARQAAASAGVSSPAASSALDSPGTVSSWAPTSAAVARMRSDAASTVVAAPSPASAFSAGSSSLPPLAASRSSASATLVGGGGRGGGSSGAASPLEDLHQLQQNGDAAQPGPVPPKRTVSFRDSGERRQALQRQRDAAKLAAAAAAAEIAGTGSS